MLDMAGPGGAVGALATLFRAIVGGTIANGVALVSGDGAAVSLWRRPGRINPGLWESARGLPDMARAFRTGRDRSRLLSATLRAHQPRDRDWWYLQFIGVRPDAQGAGLGGARRRLSPVVDHFLFDEDGRIASVRGFYNPGRLAGAAQAVPATARG